MTQLRRRPAPHRAVLAILGALAALALLVLVWPRGASHELDSVRPDGPTAADPRSGRTDPLVAPANGDPTFADTESERIASERSVVLAASDDATDADPLPAALATIEGRVVDPDGIGVADVRVRLVNESAGRRGALARTRATDADGRFDFADLALARYALFHSGGEPILAFAARMIPESSSQGGRLASVEIDEARTYSVEVRFVPTATLVVRVFDASARALADADVAVRWSGTSVGSTTDANGELSFPGLEAGSYTVRVRTDDSAFTPREIELENGEYRIEAFDLGTTLGGRVAGRVVDANGTPVTGLELEAVPRDEALRTIDRDFEIRARTDLDGRFTLGRLAPGQYALTVQRPASRREPSLTHGACEFEIHGTDLELGDLVVGWGSGWAVTGELEIADGWFDALGVDRETGWVEVAFESERVVYARELSPYDTPSTGSAAVRQHFQPARLTPWKHDAVTFTFSSDASPSDQDWPTWRPRLVVRVLRERGDPAPFERLVPLQLERGARTQVTVTLP